MSKHHGRRIDRHTAERLLRGASVDVPVALAGLLAAAAAPPRDGELGGEHTAMAAFVEAAHRAPVPQPRSPSMIKSVLAKLLTVKVAAGAAAIFAAGGVATVAVTGHLPLPTGSSSSASPTSSHPAASSSIAPTSTHAPGETSAKHEPSPSPSLVGLCHAYATGAGANHGKALDSPAFTALITAAGGRTKVDGYCTTLVKERTATSTPVLTTDSAVPTSAPGNSSAGHEASTDHRTGAPSTHPTGAPTTHAKP